MARYQASAGTSSTYEFIPWHFCAGVVQAVSPTGLDCLTAVNQLTLLLDRITRADPWSDPGLLLVGDAAHVISPVSVNGLNFAVLEAVEAANRLAGSAVADPVEPTGVNAVERARRSQLDREQAQQKRVELDTAHRGPAATAGATRARVGAGGRRGWVHAAGFAR